MRTWFWPRYEENSEDQTLTTKTLSEKVTKISVDLSRAAKTVACVFPLQPSNLWYMDWLEVPGPFTEREKN